LGEAQASVYYIDAVAGYYYIVQGNYDVFYMDSNGNRFWVQAYQWDINGSYVIFQSPVTGRLYLVVSNSVKPVLSTMSWFSAPATVSYPAVTVVFPAPWGTTRSGLIRLSSISIMVLASYSPAAGVTVVNTTTLSFNNALITLSAPSASSAGRYTWYNATVTVSYVASLTYNATVVVRSIFGADTLLFNDGSLYYKLPVITYVHAYGFSSNQSVVVGAYTGLEDASSSTTTFYPMFYYVTVSASGTAVFTESRTYAPDSLGRIVADNGNILVDATGKLQRATASYTISSMSLMLYATSLRVTLSNDTASGFILAINTTEVAQRVRSINPVVYVRELNRFYPLALYGYGSERTIIAVPAALSAGTYTIDIIWNYPFMIGSWANITATVYAEPGDVLARLLVSGYVEANTVAEPHYVKIVGAASFTLLAGRLVEVNMSYAPEADLPIALPFIDGEPIYIEMPLPNGAVYRATLTAYDGAVYAPHIYAWRFGVDDYIVVPNNPVFSGLNTITVMVFLNWLGEYGQVPVAKFGAVAGRREWMMYVNNSYKWVWQVFDDRAGTFSEVGGASPAPRQVHLTGVYGNGYQAIYENGVLKDSKTANIAIRSTAEPVNIGRRGDGAGYFNGYIYYTMIYSRVLSDYEISNTYMNKVVNASGLVVFLDPTFYNGTHYIDLSGSGNHGVPYGGVARVLDNRTWIYTVLNSPLGMSGYVVFRFFPPGTRIAYGPYTVELAQTLRPVLVGNHTLYMPRAGDTLVGNLTIYSITVYDTVYPVDPVNATITVLSPVALNPYPLHVISLAMGIGRGSWAYKIPVYVSFHEIPQHASLTLRLRLPLGVWIKQRLLSPSLEDLAIVSSEGELLPFLVLYWESTDYAVVYVKYPKPLQSTTLTLYVYLKNTLLWGSGASFQSLSAFDLINPSGAFTFTDPVWNYTLMSTMGIYNYYVFTSWDKILIASTPTDGVLLDPASGKLVEYHGAYRIERDVTPITAARELSIVVKGSAFHVYADGTPALSVDLASIFPAGVPATIHYVGWSGTAVYVSTTSFYTYSVGSMIGGVQEAPPAQVNRPSQQQSPPTFDWWSVMPMLFILVVLAVVVKLISGGTTSGQGGGVRLP
jgi:hypothetical protein